MVDHAEPEPKAPPVSTVERVEQSLAGSPGPMSQREVRDVAKGRAASVGDALAALVTDGRVARTEGRYQLLRR